MTTFKIYYIKDVVDLIPNKKIKDTNVITRSNRLKSYLNYIDTLLINEIKSNNENHIIKVLLEYQMGPNDKSRNVCSKYYIIILMKMNANLSLVI